MFSFEESIWLLLLYGVYECHSLFLLTLRGQVERRFAFRDSKGHNTVVYGNTSAIKHILWRFSYVCWEIKYMDLKEERYMAPWYGVKLISCY
jgi:hypothetical protein